MNWNITETNIFLVVVFSCVKRQSVDLSLLRSDYRSTMTEFFGFSNPCQFLPHTVSIPQGAVKIDKQQMDDDDWALGWTLWTAYRAMTGSAIVPTDYHDVKLVRWVQHQKEDYAKFTKGESTFLSNDGFNMLSRMGFTWDIPAEASQDDELDDDDEIISTNRDEPADEEEDLDSKPKAVNKSFADEDWESHFQQLLDYNEKKGSINMVPRRSVLGKWLANLPGHFEDYMNEKPSPLTKERVEMLEDLGFHFLDTTKKSRMKETRTSMANAIVHDVVTNDKKVDDSKPAAKIKRMTGGRAGIEEGSKEKTSTKRRASVPAKTASSKKARMSLVFAPDERSAKKNNAIGMSDGPLRRSTRATQTPVKADTITSEASSARPARLSRAVRMESGSYNEDDYGMDGLRSAVEYAIEPEQKSISKGNPKDDSKMINVRGVDIMTQGEYMRLLEPFEPMEASRSVSKMNAERNRMWHQKFCSLVEFKRLKGHTCVPKSTPLLDPQLKVGSNAMLL